MPCLICVHQYDIQRCDKGVARGKGNGSTLVFICQYNRFYNKRFYEFIQGYTVKKRNKKILMLS